MNEESQELNDVESSAVGHVKNWIAAGRPNKERYDSHLNFYPAKNSVNQIDKQYPSLPEGQYWRGTNNRTEPGLMKSGAIRNSYNHTDQYEEKGLSVSPTPSTIFGYGYKYGYPVSGEVIGHGSDGEPLLKNPVPSGKLMLTDVLLRKDIERVKKINQSMKRVADKSGASEHDIFRLQSE